ncbi:anti-sigma factor antagonist [Streptomyces minutiscleroticus]|uniref:Anti-sigma factor antagonist n=1 Tax=Streptomyces minutiscleroticus TaxID=68238 RepID=A0A918P422_9ACTN|nr:STAS domain-containing protein [Streptomyces minutiscleroticus]GGY18622.1 anti-sigma factor antagonist [Streptomyces minutiscleroticus]
MSATPSMEEPDRLFVIPAVTGTITVFSLQGDLDLHTAGLLRRAFLTAPAGRLTCVVVDLERVAFVDSSGLSALIDLHRTAKAVSGWLRLAGIPAVLQPVFRITGLDGYFDCYPTVDRALTA